MYYELYIDVLFLVNFMMDSLLLLLVWKILKCPTTHGYIFLGGGVGAVLTCVLISLPIPGILKFILFHTVVNTLMIKIGLRINRKELFLKALGILYISAFLFGGILEYFHQYVRIGSLFYGLVIVSYYMIRGIWHFISRFKRAEQMMCSVTLCTKAGSHEAKALLDTGNGLTDGLTGKPVNVIDKMFAGKILTEADMQMGVRYIPYRSVGREGVLPVIKVEKMCIHQKDEIWIAEPLIGICEERISEKEEYQMILNPDILGGI